jgi:hypothetical protein
VDGVGRIAEGLGHCFYDEVEAAGNAVIFVRIGASCVVTILKRKQHVVLHLVEAVLVQVVRRPRLFVVTIEDVSEIVHEAGDCTRLNVESLLSVKSKLGCHWSCKI